jgi:hypothetical protein
MQITAQLDDSYQTRIAAIQQSTHTSLDEIIKQALDLLYEKTALMPKEKTYTSIDDLAGCLAYHGKAKTIEEMDDGVRQSIIAKWGKHDCH